MLYLVIVVKTVITYTVLYGCHLLLTKWDRLNTCPKGREWCGS